MIICSDVLLGCYKTLFQAQFGPLRQSKITNFISWYVFTRKRGKVTAFCTLRFLTRHSSLCYSSI